MKIKMNRVGLFDVDSKMPNLALMKLSAWHKRKGDIVEKYSPLLFGFYDLIYASKIFNYSHPNDAYLRENMIIGGPGFDLKKKLKKQIDHIYPDYSLYGCDYAIGYITKGCCRKCKFCIVPRMEGYIHKFADLWEFTSDQEKVVLLDNNILAYSNHLQELQVLIDSQKRIEFTQGFDIRLITKHNAEKLAELKRWRGQRLKFAFDDPSLKKIIEKKLEILHDAGITSGILQFYLLIGFNTSREEDLMRIRFLREKKISAFVMPYNKENPYQKRFARWVNRRFYKYESFQHYLGGIKHGEAII